MSAELHELLGSLDPAMAVVTTVAGDERAGCLIGFHAQSSIEPARYAVWLSKANHTYRVALHADHLAVHFLAGDDLELARLFGTTTGDDHDKLTRCRWEPGLGGVPVLTACPHRFVGRKVAVLDEGGDHVCFVLEPQDVSEHGALRPLRLSATEGFEPGHASEERPVPATERARG